MKPIKPILFCALSALALALTSGMVKDWPTHWNQHILLAITISITFILTLLFSKWDGFTLKQLGVVPTGATLKKVAIGFGIGLLLAMLQPIIILGLGHFTMSHAPSVKLYSVLFYLTLYLLVAMREELAFRGYPLVALHRAYGFWTAQLVIALLFSLEHRASGMGWLQAFLGAGTGAFLFGVAAIRTRGIALPIGLHAAWNFGQWSFGFKNEQGLFEGVVEKGFETIVDRNGWIAYGIIMLIAIGGFYFYRPKKTIHNW